MHVARQVLLHCTPEGPTSSLAHRPQIEMHHACSALHAHLEGAQPGEHEGHSNPRQELLVGVKEEREAKVCCDHGNKKEASLYCGPCSVHNLMHVCTRQSRG